MPDNLEITAMGRTFNAGLFERPEPTNLTEQNFKKSEPLNLSANKGLSFQAVGDLINEQGQPRISDEIPDVAGTTVPEGKSQEWLSNVTSPFPNPVPGRQQAPPEPLNPRSDFAGKSRSLAGRRPQSYIFSGLVTIVAIIAGAGIIRELIKRGKSGKSKDSED